MRYLVLVFFVAGCAAPWRTADIAVNSVLASVRATHEIIGPELGEDVDEAFTKAENVLVSGVEIVNVWSHTSQCPDGWAKWVLAAIKTTKQILLTITAFGVEVPPLVMVGLTAATHVLGLLL